MLSKVAMGKRITLHIENPAEGVHRGVFDGSLSRLAEP
jgi:hypothetical protein